MDNCGIDKIVGKILLMYDFFLFDAMTYLRNQSLKQITENKNSWANSYNTIIKSVLIVKAASFKENSGYHRFIFEGAKIVLHISVSISFVVN